jgi:2-oxoacid:acceptor oxidoreductase delta subunit (pyruvate/2-ketoisovalerate family)
LGREVFAALQPVEFKVAVPREADTVAGVEHAHPVLAAPSVLDVGNAIQRQTGAWRVERPLIDRNVCTRCGLCFVECPDGAISLDEEGYPVVDYDHCKGCMICRHLCPLHAIEHEQETRAW